MINTPIISIIKIVYNCSLQHKHNPSSGNISVRLVSFPKKGYTPSAWNKRNNLGKDGYNTGRGGDEKGGEG